MQACSCSTIFEAIENGHPICVKKNKEGVNQISEEGVSPLFTAVTLATNIKAKKNYECLEAVLELKPDLNAALPTPPLAVAAGTICAPNPKVIKLLVAAGADPLVKFEISKNSKTSPFYIALKNNNQDCVAAFLATPQSSAKILKQTSSKGETYLHFAASSGWDKSVKALLIHNADVMAQNKEGYTPLHLAAFFGHGNTVKTLLATKLPLIQVDPTIKTPLELAIEKNHLSVVQILLNFKAEITPDAQQAAESCQNAEIRKLISAKLAEQAAKNISLKKLTDEINSETVAKPNIVVASRASSDLNTEPLPVFTNTILHDAAVTLVAPTAAPIATVANNDNASSVPVNSNPLTFGTATPMAPRVSGRDTSATLTQCSGRPSHEDDVVRGKRQPGILQIPPQLKNEVFKDQKNPALATTSSAIPPLKPAEINVKNHPITPAKLPPLLLQVFDMLWETTKIPVYLYGGFPRDIFRKKIPNDGDLFLKLAPSDVKKILDNRFDKDISCNIIGDGIPIVELIDNKTKFTIQISQLNTSLEEKVFSLDFTCNTLLFEYPECTIFDYFKAREDIKNNILRTVTDAHSQFSKDPFQILRAFFYTARDNNIWASGIESAIKENKHRLKDQSPNRLLTELLKLANQPQIIPRYMELLIQHKVHEEVFPKIQTCFRSNGLILQFLALLDDFGNFERLGYRGNKFFILQDITAKIRSWFARRDEINPTIDEEKENIPDARPLPVMQHVSNNRQPLLSTQPDHFSSPIRMGYPQPAPNFLTPNQQVFTTAPIQVTSPPFTHLRPHRWSTY